MTRTVTLPSGLTVTLRGLRTREFAMLSVDHRTASPKKKRGAVVRQSHPLDRIYSSVTESVVSPGPYQLKEGALDWGDVLQCDRFTALLHIRDLTFGAFEFQVRCMNPTCERFKKLFTWSLDLTELEVKDLPATSRDKVANGDRTFDITIAGKQCRFRLLTGYDEANAPEPPESLSPEEKVVWGLARRVFEVEGIDGDEARLAWWEDVPLRDLYNVTSAVEAPDGGVETTTIVECPYCEEETTIDVPFGDKGFLTPSTKSSTKTA